MLRAYPQMYSPAPTISTSIGSCSFIFRVKQAGICRLAGENVFLTLLIATAGTVAKASTTTQSRSQWDLAQHTLIRLIQATLACLVVGMNKPAGGADQSRVSAASTAGQSFCCERDSLLLDGASAVSALSLMPKVAQRSAPYQVDQILIIKAVLEKRGPGRRLCWL